MLDYQNETPLEDVLASIERPAARSGAALSRGGEAEVFDLERRRCAGHATAHIVYSRAEKAPNPREGGDVHRPGHYGARSVPARDSADLRRASGQPRSMLKARAKGTAVVFHLHNFGYNDRRGFEDVDAIIFPSEYSRRLYCAGSVSTES